MGAGGDIYMMEHEKEERTALSQKLTRVGARWLSTKQQEYKVSPFPPQPL
jgi:hypothetical protein